MNIEEAINSDDIEVAILAANILRKQKGKNYTVNLVKKYGKYEFRKGIGLSLKRHPYSNILNLFNNYKLINTPLLSMTQLNNNIVYKVGDDSLFTFEIPNKL